MGTVKILENWTLWASSGAAPNQQRAELKLRLTALRLTVEGVAPSDPLGMAYGPTGVVYQYDSILVATDVSLKDDGSMDAAFVSMGERIPARSVAVFRIGVFDLTRTDGYSLGARNVHGHVKPNDID